MSYATEVVRREPAPHVIALRRDLSACLWDGLLYCVMVGIGETYLAAFVLHLGLGPLLSGLVTTVPVVAGAFLQLAAPALVQRIGSYPRFVAWCAYGQAAMYFPLAILALFSAPLIRFAADNNATGWLAFVLFVVVTLYWAFSLACSPAWTTLVGEIIPARIRPHYFGKRNRILQFATLGGLLVHGAVMQGLTKLDPQQSPLGIGWISLGFASMFVVAGLCRLLSGYLLSTYSEPRHKIQQVRVPLLQLASHGRGDSRFLLFIAAMGVATQIAQPFFNPFMLEKLRANPAWYAALLAAAFVGKGVAQPIAAKWASGHGASRPLWIGACLLIPLPLIWFITDSLPVLLIGQFVSGAAWGTFELATFLRNFEATKPAERMSVLANFNCLNETAKTSGSLIGGRILGTNDDPSYAWVFGVSVAARALAVGALSAAARRATTRPNSSIIDAGPGSASPGAGAPDNLVTMNAPESDTPTRARIGDSH